MMPRSRLSAQQLEFYNYTANGLAETGNSYATDSLAQTYRTAYSTIKNGELYAQYTTAGYPLSAYTQALSDYFTGQGATGCSAGSGSNADIVDMQS